MPAAIPAIASAAAAHVATATIGTAIFGAATLGATVVGGLRRGSFKCLICQHREANATMSLMTIAFYPNGQRATVSVDTFATQDGRVFNMTKLFPIAHLGAIVCGCGLMRMLSVIAGAASASQTLDDLCNAIPGLVQHMRDELANAPDVAPVVLEQAAETVLAVVAYKDDRIMARVWNGYADPAYAVHDVTTAYFAPHSVELRGIVPLTLEEHERVAREQVARWRPRAQERGMLLGGKLLYANVDEVGISVRELCDLEAPAAVAAPFAVPVPGRIAARRSC